MVELWVLHVISLWRAFDQSLLKIFERVQEIRSGQESVKYGQMEDGRTSSQMDTYWVLNVKFP